MWLVSVICEVWFALSWLLDQFPKWYPINRETYLDRLALRQVVLLDVCLQDREGIIMFRTEISDSNLQI